MRYLFALVFLALLAYGALPYITLYRLDRALLENDRSTLSTLVDLEALRESRAKAMEKQVARTVGDQRSGFPAMMRDSARWLGNATAEVIDLDWVRETLRWRQPTPRDAYPSLISDMTYAFFESPTRFLIRVGDLGESPIHVRMTLEDWSWRLTGIYEC